MLALVLAHGLAGCAGQRKRPAHKQLPPTGRRPPAEVIRPAQVSPADEMASPERRASMRLVEQGRLLLDQDELEGATVAFRDAVNLDGTNGVAYYYLALAYAEMDRPEIALGLLDKAEAMLGYDEEWMDRIDELRIELGSWR